MQGGDTKEPERRLAAAQGRRTNIGTRRQQSAINIDSFVSSFIDTRNKHTGESLNEQQTNCKWTGCLFLESIFQSETSYPFAAAAPRAAVQCGHDPRSTIHDPRSTPSRCADIQHSTTKPGTGVKRFRNLLL
ncbi:unnamed protein product [[Candida] boidinii]|uniref:Unnamed protein product n=1 Tax=Candida boidinii TaxID=5477 RepID=A0ACB5TSA4_CANBO|nr:unnamed protein product [[Candida] boidinii]